MDFVLPTENASKQQEEALPLPISRLVLDLPRAYSLDSYRHTHKQTILLDNEEDEEEGEEEDSDEEWLKPMTRSCSVGTKEDGQAHKISFTYNWHNKTHDLPDTTHMTETPPLLDHEIRIQNQYGTIHAVAVRGSVIVIGTSHCNINAFHIQTISESLFSPPIIPPPITIPSASMKESAITDSIRSVCFPPTFHPTEDNKIIWAGTENGCLLVKNIETNDTLSKKLTDYPIHLVLRQQNMEVWTLDTEGNLIIWPLFKNEEGILLHPFSDDTQDRFVVCSKVDHAILDCPNKLWMSVGNTLHCFDRLASSITLILTLPSDMTKKEESTCEGDKVHLLLIPFYPDCIFTVHADGHVNAWTKSVLEHKRTLSVAIDRVSSAINVDTFHVWIGYQNGMIAIYDTRSEPWVAVKAWKAHINSVTHLVMDEFSVLQGMAIVSMDSEGHMAVWDGLLSEHWLEQQMASRIQEYAEINPMNVMICSWNMNAAKPNNLTNLDREKIHEWLHGMEHPDIIMIGVQEIVNLASKKFTARSILSSNRKFETIQEADDFLTHRYMLWHDYFKSVMETNFGQGVYSVVKTDQLVGLFSCLFVRTDLQPRIQHCESVVVKTGLRVMNRSLHGNKGGIAIRFLLDDTSFCFVNCHLASGQSNSASRNADLTGILHSAHFPTLDQDQVPFWHLFKAHSDGRFVLEHEVCFISGDFNYRIDMERQQVLDLIHHPPNTKLEAWETLQREDQLKKHNPFLRHFGFKEAPILFDPTYKYDKNSSEYDCSEKRRIPAWCDRILYKAPPTLTNEYYRRHEVKVSDHRPISAGFTVLAKKVDQERMEKTKAILKIEWQKQMEQYMKSNKVHYVKQFSLCDEKEALNRLEKAEWNVEKVVMDLFRDKGLCLA